MSSVIEIDRPEAGAEDLSGAHPLFAAAPRSVEFNKLRKRLVRNMREAIEKFGMARAGEKWLVAISGGKDSYGMPAMPPRLMNDDGDVEVLRPMIYCAEPDLEKFAEHMAFPIIPCDLCGSQEGLERNAMKARLNDIEKRMPGRKDIMIRALGNVRPSHLLDPKLFDFLGLQGAPGDGAPGG